MGEGTHPLIRQAAVVAGGTVDLALESASAEETSSQAMMAAEPAAAKKKIKPANTRTLTIRFSVRNKGTLSVPGPIEVALTRVDPRDPRENTDPLVVYGAYEIKEDIKPGAVVSGSFDVVVDRRRETQVPSLAEQAALSSANIRHSNKGLFVVVDPDGLLPELFRHNNVIRIA